MMRTVCGCRFKTWLSNCAPFMPGIRMSEMTTSNGCCSIKFSASSALSTKCVSHSRAMGRIAACKTLSKAVSSSTKRIRTFGGGLPGAGADVFIKNVFASRLWRWADLATKRVGVPTPLPLCRLICEGT